MLIHACRIPYALYPILRIKVGMRFQVEVS
jgi:hypothetical protein